MKWEKNTTQTKRVINKGEEKNTQKGSPIMDKRKTQRIPKGSTIRDQRKHTTQLKTYSHEGADKKHNIA